MPDFLCKKVTDRLIKDIDLILDNMNNYLITGPRPSVYVHVCLVSVCCVCGLP